MPSNRALDCAVISTLANRRRFWQGRTACRAMLAGATTVLALVSSPALCSDAASAAPTAHKVALKKARPSQYVPASPDYLMAARIVDVSPVPVKPQDTFTVSAEIIPYGNVSNRELASRIVVMLDGTELPSVVPKESTLPPLASGLPDADPPSAAREALATQGVSAGKTTGLDFLVRAPEDYFRPTRPANVTISLFSRPDGRVVASKVVALPALAVFPIAASAAPLEYRIDSGWKPTATIIAALAAVLASVVATYFAWSRQRAADAALTRAHSVTADVQRTLRNNPVNEAPPTSEVPFAPQLPPSINEAALEGRLALVLGTGASAQAGMPNSLNLWLAVLNNLQGKDAASKEDVEQLRAGVLRSGPYPVLEAIVGKLGRSAVASALRDELARGPRSPGRFHGDLARLGCQIIVDLTWDQLTATALASTDARVYTLKDSEGLTSALRQGKVCILKPFGDPSDLDSLCITIQEFRRALSRNPDYERTLASIFGTHNVLFLGVGLPGIDDLMRALPPSVESTSREHAAVVPRGRSDDLWEAGTGASFKVRLVTYVPGPSFQEIEIGRAHV